METLIIDGRRFGRPMRKHEGFNCRSYHWGGGTPSPSTAVCIPMAMKLDDVGVPFSELWAGPTYSNSPPPSSLPIPKFSKRTVSLQLPTSLSPIHLRPVANSAPPSPTPQRTPSPISFLSHVQSVFQTSDQHYLQQQSIHQTHFATKALRRILNLHNHHH